MNVVPCIFFLIKNFQNWWMLRLVQNFAFTPRDTAKIPCNFKNPQAIHNLVLYKMRVRRMWRTLLEFQAVHHLQNRSSSIFSKTISKVKKKTLRISICVLTFFGNFTARMSAATSAGEALVLCYSMEVLQLILGIEKHHEWMRFCEAVKMIGSYNFDRSEVSILSFGLNKQMIHEKSYRKMTFSYICQIDKCF